jgi:hypothetical protein
MSSQSLSIFSSLPRILIAFVLEYDRRFVIKNGELVYRDGKPVEINRLSAYDYRRNMLSRIPTLVAVDDTFEVSLCVNRDKRLRIIYINRYGYFLIQYQTVTYNYNIGQIGSIYFYHIADPSHVDGIVEDDPPENVANFEQEWE